MKKNSKKMRGEIYTPENIVKQILDGSWYLPSTSGILEKHIMDNSCGKGAFLKEIVTRYVLSFANFKRGTQDLLKEHLETYIHGIEINPDACVECVEVLNKTLFDMGLDIRPSWDIKCENLSTCPISPAGPIIHGEQIKENLPYAQRPQNQRKTTGKKSSNFLPVPNLPS